MTRRVQVRVTVRGDLCSRFYYTSHVLGASKYREAVRVAFFDMQDVGGYDWLNQVFGIQTVQNPASRRVCMMIRTAEREV